MSPSASSTTRSAGCSHRSGWSREARSNPTTACRALLTEAAAVANGTARAIVFKTRDPEAYKYPDRRWKTGFIGDDYRWLHDDGVGGRNLDARTLFFYFATVNTPAMALHIPGVGSQYAYADHDSTGTALDGARNYALTVPPDVPAKDFWSIVLYDPQTRSELQTGQPFPSKNNTTSTLATNDDGSITLTFGPTSPRPIPRTGSRPCPARSGSPSCGSTGPSNPGSSTPGSRATSNPGRVPVQLERLGQRGVRVRPQ